LGEVVERCATEIVNDSVLHIFIKIGNDRDGIIRKEAAGILGKVSAEID
jgi:hypothetical protein